MSSNSLEPKIITSANIDGKPGSFSLEHPVDFEYCRERFAARFLAEAPGFFFLHRENQRDQVDAFLAKTEQVLEIRSQGYELSTTVVTNRPAITWINISRFWAECSLRRSLLTILLRCSMVYNVNKDNYEEALFSDQYCKQTMNAIRRFLFGFTRYVGPDLGPTYLGATILSVGWVSYFESKDDSFIRKILTWPTQRTKFEPSISDPGDMWY